MPKDRLPDPRASGRRCVPCQRNSLRQDRGCKLVGAMAPGLDDRGESSGRDRWLWTLDDKGRCGPCSTSNLGSWRICSPSVSISTIADDRNGVLRVLPGTHKLGRLSADQITAAQAEITSVNATVKTGGAVLMKPLLLHSSSLGSDPSHRRVIHIDFASAGLPGGLSWPTEQGLARLR